MMKSKNIQDPETRIQDQLILATVFIASAKFEYSIFCNNRVYSGLSAACDELPSASSGLEPVESSRAE